jgi:hypothetical protein
MPRREWLPGPGIPIELPPREIHRSRSAFFTSAELPSGVSPSRRFGPSDTRFALSVDLLVFAAP